MVSPPFNINQAVPADTDIVSQFPAAERAFRDTTESWLLVNHDTSGFHPRIDMVQSAAHPGADPVSGNSELYVSLSRRLKIRHSDGFEEFVGDPPGVVVFTAQNGVPNGWLAANGQEVSRTTYADLFLTIGTVYGSGDGVSTFNIPDIKGRMIINENQSSGRLSTATVNSVSLGGTGGNELSTLVAGNVPGGVPVSVSVTGVNLNVSGSISGTSTGSTASGSVSGTATGGSVTGTATGSVGGTASVTSSDTQVHTDGVSDNFTSVAGAGLFRAQTRKQITSSGNISASFSNGSISGSISSPATVSGSFSGAAVSAGTVSGSFTGSGTGGTGTGSGATTGAATSFSNMPPVIVLKAIIRY